MKKKIALLFTILAFTLFTFPAWSQGPGNPNLDDQTYPDRDHDWVWGENGEETCVRQCVLVSIFECVYIDGREDAC